MDWRRLGDNTLEKVRRAYRDTKPKAKQEEAEKLTATFREFVNKMKAQKKAMDMAIIFNAETKEMLEVQKKATDVVVDFNAEIPHAGTQVEEEAVKVSEETSKVLNTAELQGNAQRVRYVEINLDWDKEAIKVLESTPKVLNTAELDRPEDPVRGDPLGLEQGGRQGVRGDPQHSLGGAPQEVGQP